MVAGDYSVDLSMLKKLVLARGIPGWEDEIRDLLLSMLRELGREPVVDGHGNVLLELPGEGPTILFEAHMDDLGLLITGIMDDGQLSFRPVGGLDDRVLPARHVEILGEKGLVPGVIGFPSPHLNFEREKNVIPWHKLRINIGVSSREEALELGVKPGRPAFFKKHFTVLAGGKAVASRGLDDRAGVFVLLDLARRLVSRINEEGSLRYRIVFAWTVREEIGLFGAQALAARFKVSKAVAVDTMACCRPEVTGDMRPGRGPVLRLMDNYYIASRSVAEALRSAARSIGFELVEATGGGTTDATAFQKLGIESAAIGIPLLNTHTFAEIAYLSDIAGAVRLLEEAVVGGHF